jgi:hypothetical protein
MTSPKSRSFIVLAVATFLSALTPQSAPADEQSPQWNAGSAFVVITPEDSMWMAGYASRNKPSEGVALDLYAKALALKDNDGHQGVIITLDLISVPRPLRDVVAQRVQKEYGIPASSLMMNCSHTHCGPELRTSESSLQGLEAEREKLARAYATKLEEKLVALVGVAIENSEPSRLSYCRAKAAFAMNRRLPNGDSFRNSPNPNGPVDHDVPVLKVENADGELKTLLFGYACHNTTIGIYEFCGDYAGYAQRYLQEAHPGVTAMFVEGCGGDQNPYPRRTIELARVHGKTLATAVDAALQTPQQPVNGPLKIAMSEVELDYATPPSQAELQERLKSTNKYIKRHAERLLDQIERNGAIRTSYSPLIQTLQFGDDLTMIALPGETVVDYSLRLKKELSGRNVWVAGYSNDVFAYVPSLRILREGGYEGGGAMIYMTTVVQPGPFTETVEERIIEGVHALLRAPAVSKE